MRLRPSLCLIALLSVSIASLSLTPAFAQAPSRTLVRAGHLLDVHTGKLLDAQTIVVTGDKITAIAATSATPANPGDAVVDLGTLTVLPGLIDVHTHITSNPNFDLYHAVTSTDAKEAIDGVVNAKTTLMAGFTSVRNVGAGGYVDVDLRDAINAGEVPGPHMQVSGPPLGITGGHCDDNCSPSTTIRWLTV